MGPGFSSDQSGKGGLTAPRRTPQNHGEGQVFFDGVAHQGSLTDHMDLADKFTEVPWADPVCKGSGGIRDLIHVLVEQIQVVHLRFFPFFRSTDFGFLDAKSILPVRRRKIKRMGTLSRPVFSLS